MAAPGIVNVRLDSQAVRKTLLKMRQVGDLRPYWPHVQTAFLAAEAEWFASRGGGSWAPHAAGYTAWLSKKGGGNGLLRLTDSLYNSLTTKGSGNVWEATSNRVLAGTSNPVANIHFSKREERRSPLDGGSAIMQRHMIEAMKAIGEQIGDTWKGRP